MQYTIKEISNHLFEKVDSIYDTFKGFFGEEYVDLQKPKEKEWLQKILSYVTNSGIVYVGPTAEQYDSPLEMPDEMMAQIESFFSLSKVTVYVWWPRVTVTNEFGKSIDIQDLYAKVEVQINGSIPYENRGFQLNRSTYTIEQFMSEYLHSHVERIPKGNFQTFMSPCLGQGPIKDTIATLKNDYDEVTWMLFCQELSMYVTVESISGGPWKRIENIGIGEILYPYTGYNFHNKNISRWERIYTLSTLKDFIKYYLEHGHLSINYRYGGFMCGMPYHEYIIDVSNSFIDYYNSKLRATRYSLSSCYREHIIEKTIIVNGRFYKTNNYISDNIQAIARHQNQLVLTFKGKEIRTNIITNNSTDEVSTSTVLDHNVAMYILSHILDIINLRYKNEHNSNHRDEVTTAGKKVYYL